MFLKDLLKDIVDFSDLPDIDVTSICIDSRQVLKGSLFFALPGSTVDGSTFIAAAEKGGAVAIICQSCANPTITVPLIKVKDARVALAKVASRFFGEPSLDFYLCGVTGTNGKTTITYLLEKFWHEFTSGIVGTVNFRYKDKVLPAPNTTPDVVTLQNLFHEMKDESVNRVAIEASSHGLLQKRLSECHYDSAVFTNLTQDHLDYHGDMECYYESKKLLFTEELLTSHKNNKLAIINIDDVYGERLFHEIKGLGYTVETMSMKNVEASICVKEMQSALTGTKATIMFKGSQLDLETNLIGEHNLKNIMCALLVGFHSGCKLRDMLDQIKDFNVPGRLERVGQTNCFVDYAHTPDALNNVMQSLRDVSQQDSVTRRLIVVFGCGGDRDQSKRPLMGGAVAQFSDVSVVTSDNPRTENPEAIIEQILPGVTQYQKPYDQSKGYLVLTDRKEAIHQALEIAKADDVVLIAGKGHEDYQILGTTKIHFDDREVVKDWLDSWDKK